MGWFPIRGLDRKAWDTDVEDDLVALKPRVGPDALSRWFMRIVFPLYHRHIGEKLKAGIPKSISWEIVQSSYPMLNTRTLSRPNSATAFTTTASLA